MTCLSAATKDWAITNASSGFVWGKLTGRAVKEGMKETKRAEPRRENTEADWSIPPELTPTARSLTMASSVNCVLSTSVTPLAYMTARAEAETNAAELLSPPPTGTVPSNNTSILLGLKPAPYCFRRISRAPRRPDLK